MIGALRYWWGNRRSALNTIRLCTERRLRPLTLVDFGASNSEWAKYLVERWPGLKVHSYEPNQNAKPIGTVQRLALGNCERLVSFFAADREGYMTDGDPTAEFLVQCVRFDEQAWRISTPSILKVDCENSTLEALQGCGALLSTFAAVHVELQNCAGGPNYRNNQAAIWRLMLEAGFTEAHCVDAAVWPRNINYYDVLFFRDNKQNYRL